MPDHAEYTGAMTFGAVAGAFWDLRSTLLIGEDVITGAKMEQRGTRWIYTLSIEGFPEITGEHEEPLPPIGWKRTMVSGDGADGVERWNYNLPGIQGRDEIQIYVESGNVHVATFGPSGFNPTDFRRFMHRLQQAQTLAEEQRSIRGVVLSDIEG